MQDVVVLLGLHINGYATINPVMNDMRVTCQEPLSLTPDDGALTRTCSQLWPLRENFVAGPANNASEDVVLQFVQTYIWRCSASYYFSINGTMKFAFFLPLLLCEEAGSLWWGTTALAYLYHKLSQATSPGSNQIVGSLILIQVRVYFINC